MAYQKFLVSIKKRKTLYKRMLSLPNQTRQSQYKAYRNKLNTLIRIAKCNYFSGRFESVKNNLKETWKLINQVINKSKRKPSLPNTFNYRNKTLTDPSKIANHFCDYFTNIDANLAKQIPSVDTPFNSFLTARISETIFIHPDITELYNICQSLKSGKAAGSDNIAMNVIKKSIEFIAQPLIHIINCSLLSGIYPDILKLAKLIPVFKANDPENFSNYRPISLLSNFSKIFEKVMHNRITDFVNQFEIPEKSFNRLFTDIYVQ